jgi:hypothetical protein
MSSTEDIQYSQHVDGLMNVDDHNDSSTSYDNRSKLGRPRLTIIA